MPALESTTVTLGWQTVVSAVGTVLSFMAILLLKAAGNKVKQVDTKLDTISSNIDEIEDSMVTHGTRLTVIETNYVRREDLETVVHTLQEDLTRSFNRAHARIDELYKRPGGTDA